MKTKKKINNKLIISVFVTVVTILSVFAAVVTVLAINTKNFNSDISIRFTAVDIDGEVEAAYRVGNGSWTSLNGDSPYVFKASQETKNAQMNSPDIELTSSNDYAEFCYTFRNFGHVDYTAILSFQNVDSDNKNITIQHQYGTYNVTKYSDSVYGLVVEGTDSADSSKIKYKDYDNDGDQDAYTEMTYYIRLKVTDKKESAYYSSDIFWLLEKYDATPGQETIKLAETEFTLNDDQTTYSASYKGATATASSSSVSAQATTDNVWVVPANFGSARVTKVIKGKDFESNTKVVISNGIEEIADRTFDSQRNLMSVYIPGSVSAIGNNAFAGCTSLTDITIPNSVTSIGDMAFNYCTGLTSVTIGSGVTSIGDMAFWDCKGLTSVTIPDSITTIDYCTFDGCSQLSKVTFPTTLTTIGTAAFRGCAIEEINLPSNVTTIGSQAFANNTATKSITIPSSVTTLKAYAFYDCYNVEELYFNADLTNNPTDVNTYAFCCLGRDANNCVVYVGDNVTKLTDYLFLGSTGITYCYIPSSTTLGEYVFANTNMTFRCSWNGSNIILGGNLGTSKIITAQVSRTVFEETIKNPTFTDANGKAYFTLGHALAQGGTIKVLKDFEITESIGIHIQTTLLAEKDVTVTCSVDNSIYIYSSLTIGEVGGNSLTFKANGITGYMLNVVTGKLILNSAIIDGNGTAKGVIAGNEALWNEDPTYVACYVYMNGGEIKNCSDLKGAAIGIHYKTYLEINGGKIYNNTGTATGTSDTLRGVILVSRGDFVMTGGEISNNTLTGYTKTNIITTKSSSYGCGLYICDGGTFIMSGTAKFSNNKLVTGNTYGANIYIAENTTAVMTGGTIESTSSTADAMFGGGVANVGTFYMLGGTIKNTKATTGGGIANGGTLYVAGGTITGCNSVNSSGTATTYGNAIATAGATHLAGGNITGDISIGYQSVLFSTTYGSLIVNSLLEVAQSAGLSYTTNQEALTYFKDMTGKDYEGMKTPYTLTLCQLDSSTYEAKAESNFTSNYANKTTAIVTYSSAVTGSLSHFTLTSPTTLTLAMGSGSGYDTNSIYLKK